jgi:hypothetical protein
MSKAHAKLSASGSSRWLYCPGSVKAESYFEEKESSFSKEGTCAHELAELCLRSGKDADEWIGKPLIENKYWVVDDEMVGYVQEYVDYVRSILGKKEIEQRVDFSDWVPEGFGTCDVIITDHDTLTIVDLKYGKGVMVDAQENSQAMLYALGALSEREAFQDFAKVVIIIHQPRLDHISVWETTPLDLYAWGQWVADKATLTLTENPERIAGEKQCRFCRAKATCPALLKLTEETIAADFEDLSAETIEHISDKRLKDILDQKRIILSWLDAVEEYVKEKAMGPGGFPGYKIVEGRSMRKWVDEKMVSSELEKLLGDRAYSKKVISPAQAEKALGKSKSKDIQSFIIKPSGAPTLVKDSDKRETLKKETTIEDFD